VKQCSQCGIQIPEGQEFCSMCYGDIDYGRDGYYRAMVEEQEREKREAHEEEQ